MRHPIGFAFVVLIDWFGWVAFSSIGVAFAMINLGLCTNIETCVKDVSLTIANLNSTIARRIAIKAELKDLIELHLDCYKYLINVELSSRVR